MRTRDIEKRRSHPSVEVRTLQAYITRLLNKFKCIVNDCCKVHEAWLASSHNPISGDYAVDQYKHRLEKVIAKVNTLEHISLLGDVLVTLAIQREQTAILDALAKLPSYKIRGALDSLHSKQLSRDIEHVSEPTSMTNLEYKLRNSVADSQRCIDFLQSLGLSLDSTNVLTTAHVDSDVMEIVEKKLDQLSEMKLCHYKKGLAARCEEHLKELLEQKLEYEKKFSDILEEHKEELITQRDNYEKKLSWEREEHRQEIRNVKAGYKDDISTLVQARQCAEEREKTHRQRAEVAEQQERRLLKDREEIEYQFRLFIAETERQQARNADDERAQRELYHKETERQKLRELGMTNKLALQTLVNLVGTNAVTQAKLKELKVPGKEWCLLSLRNLWRGNSNFITKVTPHDLLNNPDILLLFDTQVIAQARCIMYMVRCWGYTPYEFLATEWDLGAMNRLQYGLVPHEDQEPLSSLKQDVDYICLALREAIEQIQAPQFIGMLNASFASSMPTQWPSLFNTYFSSSDNTNAMIPSNGGTFGQPTTTGSLVATTNQLPDDTGPEPMKGIEHTGMFNTSLQKQNRSLQECQNFKQNKCYKSAKECQFRHPICAHFSRGVCVWGGKCHWDHNPFSVYSENTGMSFHNTSFGNSFTDPNPTTNFSINPKKDKVCSKFLQNKCQKGPSCTYQHPLSRIPCPLYPQNKCPLGPSCNMIHDPSSSSYTNKEARTIHRLAESLYLQQPGPGPAPKPKSETPCKHNNTWAGCQRLNCEYLHSRHPGSWHASQQGRKTVTFAQPPASSSSSSSSLKQKIKFPVRSSANVQKNKIWQRHKDKGRNKHK